jgi:hypothetical protein
MGKSLSDLLSLSTVHSPSNQKNSWKPKSRKLLIFAVAALSAGVAIAQTDATRSLAERSTIIVRGKVLKTNASDEPLLAPSTRTAIITVEQMYAGKEIAGDQAGRTATVILSKAEGVKAGQEAVFFGNARFLGKSLTIADEGEVQQATVTSAMQSTVEQAMQVRRDKPVLDRMAVAKLIFRGTVSSVKPLESTAATAQGQRPAHTSEHDPEWQVATVQVIKPMRGGTAGENVTVLFAASDDIVWFHAPKLKPGQDAIFLAHAPSTEEEATYRHSFQELLTKQTIYLVTEPFDVLAPADEDRVRRLLAAPKETK